MDKINIAFSFDNNYWRQGATAICSLLNTGSDINYNIFCLCTDDVTEETKKTIQKLVKENSSISSISFIDIGKILDNSYEARGLSKATYGRLLLHKFLPDTDKIIYADVDILFKGNLKEAWDTNIEDYLFAAVKSVRNNLDENFTENLKYPFWSEYLSDIKGKYFNTGFMLLNLKKIREQEMEKVWLPWTNKKLFFQDQDILNITGKNQVKYLPTKFNVIDTPNSYTYRKALKENIITTEEYLQLKTAPEVIHYTGRKPWNSLCINYSKEWWEFVYKRTPFFAHFFRIYLRNKLFEDLYFGQKQLMKKIVEIHWKTHKKIIKIFGFELFFKI